MQIGFRQVRLLRGFTLPEVLIASAVATLVFGVIASAMVHLGSSMLALETYSKYEQQSQLALEILAKDVRQASRVTDATSQMLVLDTPTGPITYRFLPIARQLTRALSNSVKTVLTDCSQLQFDLYQRGSKTNVYDQFPSATPSIAKVVEVTWRCGMTNANSTVNSTYVQSSKIVLRKE